jgi:hypothetical protein
MCGAQVRIPLVENWTITPLTLSFYKINHQYFNRQSISHHHASTVIYHFFLSLYAMYNKLKGVASPQQNFNEENKRIKKN